MTRRQWLRATGRTAAMAALAGVVAMSRGLFGKGREGPAAPGACISAGRCRGCGALARCELPQARIQRGERS